MKITLLAHTAMPEKTVGFAAKLCYSAGGLDGVVSSLTDEKAADFVEMLSEIGHESPIEHASFTFGIEGVSRALLAQLTRHRMASYSVRSQRYVREGGFDFVIPPEIAADEELKSEFLSAMEEDRRHYESLAKKLKARHKKTLIADGLDEKSAEKTAEKMAIEDARFVLPNACDTQLIMTMNARSLKNFFAHRCCGRAQWEIQELAEGMLSILRKEFPSLFKLCGPGCVFGRCPEGKMSCGRQDEMKVKYKLSEARDD